MPFIIRIHNIAARVTAVAAMNNLAEYFREKSFMRDPRLVDATVTRGYERLFEAINHHTHTPYIFKFICPDVSNSTFGAQLTNYIILIES